MLGLYWVKTWPSTGSYLRKYSSECVFLEVLEVRGRWGLSKGLAGCLHTREAESQVASLFTVMDVDSAVPTWYQNLNGFWKTTALQSMMVKKVLKNLGSDVQKDGSSRNRADALTSREQRQADRKQQLHPWTSLHLGHCLKVLPTLGRISQSQLILL